MLGDGHLAAGDPVVVSSESGHFALAIGFVRDVGATWITLGLDRELLGVPQRLDGGGAPNGWTGIGPMRQQFAGLWEVRDGSRPGAGSGGGGAAAGGGAMPGTIPNVHPTDRAARLEASRFRIDKDELSAGLGTVRANLVSLFTARGDSKRRRLIVDREGAEGGSPRFSGPAQAPLLTRAFCNAMRMQTQRRGSASRARMPARPTALPAPCDSPAWTPTSAAPSTRCSQVQIWAGPPGIAG